jgi:heavy metal translocating P-type ATPase
MQEVEVHESRILRHHVKIGGLACSFCVSTIKKALSGVKGVKNVSVSLVHEEALVEYDPALIEPWEIDEVLIKLGYTVRDPKKLMSFEEEEAEVIREKRRLIIAGIIVGISLSMMVSMWIGMKKWWFPYAMFFLALLMVFVFGWPILKMAYYSLRRGILNQHVLMEFAAFSGIAGGLLGYVFPEFPRADFFAVSIFVTGYHILSGYTSLLVRTKSSQAVRRLLSLQPPTARVVVEGEERIVPVERLKKGDIVKVKPGETIPVDGVVVQGESGVNESIVTGESLPVEKKLEDEVISGSINLTGALLIEVTRVGEESFLYRVAKYVEEARALKPSILQLVDRILKYYVPFVIFFAVLGFIVWTVGLWILTGEPDIKKAIYASLAALVMGYPCALGMSTPLAMIRGGGEAAIRGILMRSGEAFQVFKDVKKVVLDKTGTLTEGEPEIAEIRVFEGNERYLLALAASLENNSEHPIARAIIKEAERKRVSIREADNFRSMAGFGVEGVIDGKKVVIGSVRLMEEKGVDVSDFIDDIKEMEEKGQTVVLMAVNGRLIGVMGITDRIRPDARDAIEEMKRLGLQPVMLTGDDERVGRAVAEKLGIKEVIANVLPEQKAEHIRMLQREGYRVAMVGDGINDAPALMQADVGVAIGSGTDIAIESADIIIIGSRLSALLDAYNIAKMSYNKTKQNLAIAFSFNGIGVPLAVMGIVHPIWAMMAMVASVSLVLFNSFATRLLQV